MNLLETKINDNIIFTLSNDWSGSSIHKGILWEPHITRFLNRNLSEDSIFVDVGSNYGYHSINSAKLCHSIYSFEPQKHIYDIQLKSIQFNNINNIYTFNTAIGSYDGHTTMTPIDYNHPSVNIGDLSIGENGQSVEIKTLDSININRVNFIKIDVQGYEKYVLEGAKNLIYSNYPTIIIEMEEHQLRRFNYGVVTLFELIKNLGYHIYFLEYHYPSDHICVHHSRIESFLSKNSSYIRELTETNNLNHNLEHGITQKLIME